MRKTTMFISNSEKSQRSSESFRHKTPFTLKTFRVLQNNLRVNRLISDFFRVIQRRFQKMFRVVGSNLCVKPKNWSENRVFPLPIYHPLTTPI